MKHTKLNFILVFVAMFGMIFPSYITAVSGISPCIPGVNCPGDGDPGDTTRPSISITSPTGGSKVDRTVTIEVSASDNVGVVDVEFYIDNSYIGRDTSAPFSYPWDTSPYIDDIYRIKAIAYDKAGNKRADTVDVVVDNAKIEITGGSTITKSLIAMDDAGETSIQPMVYLKNNGHKGKEMVTFKLNAQHYDYYNPTIYNIVLALDKGAEFYFRITIDLFLSSGNKYFYLNNGVYDIEVYSGSHMTTWTDAINITDAAVSPVDDRNIVNTVVLYDQEWLDRYGDSWRSNNQPYNAINDAIYQDIINEDYGNFNNEFKTSFNFLMVEKWNPSNDIDTPEEMLPEGKSYAKDLLGLEYTWDRDGHGTDDDNNGFDLLIMLSGKKSVNYHGGYADEPGNAFAMMGGRKIDVPILGSKLKAYTYKAHLAGILHELHHTYGAEHVTECGDGAIVHYIMSGCNTDWRWDESTLQTTHTHQNQYDGIYDAYNGY